VLIVEDWAEIRRLRKSEGVSISEVARLIGCSRNTVKAALGIGVAQAASGLIRPISQASWSTLTPNPTSDKPAPGRPDRLRTPGEARSFPGLVGRQSVKTSVDRCATRFVDQLSSMANRQGGRRHRLARPAQGVGSAETVDGDQLQPSRRRVLAPPRGRERFDLQERVQASFRMESLRGSISHARSPSRDNLIGLVGCQTFKHARVVTHPLTGGVSS
jgi:hypothetical protein